MKKILAVITAAATAVILSCNSPKPTTTNSNYPNSTTDTSTTNHMNTDTSNMNNNQDTSHQH